MLFLSFSPLKRYYNTVKRTRGQYGKGKGKERRHLLNCKESIVHSIFAILKKKKDEHGISWTRGGLDGV